MYEVHAVDIRKRDVWDEDEACEGMLVKHEFQIAYEKGKIRNRWSYDKIRNIAPAIK